MAQLNRFKNSLNVTDCAVFVVYMSHGFHDERNGTLLTCTDPNFIPVQDVLDLFSPENCPQMVGKPIIHLYQCCRYEIV